MNLVICEGIISAGKSQLTKSLSELMNASADYEPVETNRYLELFYKDPKRWALEMQFYMMSFRYESHLRAIEHIWKTKQVHVADRSIYGDYAFALLNYRLGNISELGMQSYNNMRDVMLRTLLTPQVCIWLDVDPAVALQRIPTRGRTCENAITLDYLIGLRECYQIVISELKERGCHVVNIGWDEFKSTEFVFEKIREYL